MVMIQISLPPAVFTSDLAEQMAGYCEARLFGFGSYLAVVAVLAAGIMRMNCKACAYCQEKESERVVIYVSLIGYRQVMRLHG